MNYQVNPEFLSDPVNQDLWIEEKSVDRPEEVD
jgi:hypothetical protein